MRPPPLPHQLDVLERVLASIEGWTASAAPVVVFDLDATLFDNRPRTLEILHELREEIADEDPDIANALLALELDTIQYLLTDTLKACNIYRADVVKSITQYWHERFFRDEYVACDVPHDGAPEFVRACYEAGAVVAYVTGRDVPGMLVGTVAKLRDEGFPIAVAGTELLLKPDEHMPDEAFKRGALPTLSRVGRVAALFDNEPANCNLGRSLFPSAMVVQLETQKVPGAPPLDDGVEVIADFRTA